MMQSPNRLVALGLSGALAACSAGGDQQPSSVALGFTSGDDVEALWAEYASARGGLTWGSSTQYPEYAKVKEGDTLLIQLEQGPCLMEFFHSRWRRANDVRRWDESVNDYGGCPYVFD